MPISSGANGWPNAYRAFQQFKARKSAPPSPPPPYTASQPQPRPIYHRYPHSNRPPPPRQQQYPPSTGCFGGSGGPCGSGGGPCGSGGSGGPCGPPTGHDGAGPCCCFCGGSALYTTGVAGANAGCFQGGMFSSKNPAYPAGQSNYALQNQGRHRCCACVIGTIIGLLLLGLILGCLLAVNPLLKTRSKVKNYLANNPGAYQVGDYIVVPKDTYIDYYLVNGSEDPCNPYNNASDYPNPTAGTQFVTDTLTTAVLSITDPPLELLPDCNSLTTNIEWTYSVPITGPTTTVVLSSGPRTGTTNVCVVTAAGLFAWSIGYCSAG